LQRPSERENAHAHEKDDEIPVRTQPGRIGDDEIYEVEEKKQPCDDGSYDIRK
jgi:hypothetical protein